MPGKKTARDKRSGPEIVRDLLMRKKPKRARVTSSANSNSQSSSGGNAAAAAAAETVSDSTDFSLARVRAAVRTTNDKFYNAAQVSARYAAHGEPRAFVESEEGGGGGGPALVSASGADASVSRIDELISARENESAAARARAIARSGARVDSIPSVLADTESVVTVDDFVRRVLALDSLDGTTKDWYDKPFQVTGFAGQEPNPRYAELRAARDALERRRKGLVAERGRISAAQRALGATAAVRDVARRVEMAQRQLALHQPPESVQLLKPASQVRALNARWRTLLGGELTRLYTAYESATAEALRALDNDDERGAVVAAYLQGVVAPVFDRYVEQLRSSTYEDMPLTRETLQNYFYEFLQLVVESMLRDERERDDASLAARRAAQEDAAGRNFAFGLDAAVRGSGAAAAAAQDERAVQVGYLRQALRLHAERDYEQWLARWITQVDASDPGVLTPALKASLERAVRNMIEAREAEYRARMARSTRVVPMHRAPSEDDVRRAYAKLVTDEVALARADAVVEQDDDDVLREQVQEVLRGDASIIDRRVLVHPRLDQLEIVEQEQSARARQIRETYVRADDADDDDDDVSDDAFVDVQAQRTARDEALRELETRVEAVREQLQSFAPFEMRELSAQAPADEARGAFTPLNLSYPLDVDRTRRQRLALASTVMRQTDTFDAEAIHKRADQMRALLSHRYAEDLTLREINRIDYALKTLAKPTRPAPLQLERRVGSAQGALEFDVGVALRDELALLARDDAAADDDERLVAAQAELRTSAFQVRLYFVPRYAPGTDRIDGVQREVLLMAVRLAPNERSATLRLLSGVALGGRYRVEAQRLDRDGELVGPVYPSRFSATVRIVARCARDRADYEVGTEVFGECEWRAAPRSRELAALAEQLRLRIEGGGAAAQRDAAEVRERAALVLRNTPTTIDEYQPPWGAEHEQSLFVAAVQDISTDVISAQCAYVPIFAKVIKRVGTFVRTTLRLAGELTPLQSAFVTRASNAYLVALLTAPSALAPDSNGTPHEMQLLALHETTRRARSDRDLAQSSPFDFAELYALFANELESPNKREALVARLRESGVFDAERRLIGVPSRAVEPLAVYANRSVPHIPIATLLYALYAPAVWQLLSWYERRFLNTMFDRFERVAREFRVRERARADRNSLPSAMRMLPLFVARQTGEGTRDFALKAANRRVVVRAATERAIDAQLARMLPQRAARASGDAVAFLRDDALLADWHERLQSLARRGLLVECERLEREQGTQRLTPRIAYRVAPPTSGAVKFYSNGGARGKWLGAHSYDSVQPDVYDIEVPVLRRGTAATIDEPARVAQRGSAPADKNFDFDALHGMVEARIARYNAVQRNVGMQSAARRAALETIGTELRDLEFLHNFLALVAPPASIAATLNAEQLRHRFRDRAALFQSLRNMVVVGSRAHA